METNTILAFILAVIFFVLYYFKGKEVTAGMKRQVELQQAIKSQEILLKTEAEAVQAKRDALFRNEIETIQSKLNESYKTIPIMASQQFDEFKKQELDSLREVLSAAANKSALADLENWKIKYEAFYRQDAINRSQSVILGKVTEHLVPFQKNFPFNPKEARFIGSPIDLIVFDGIDNEDIVDIYILEIKTGNSSLNKRQRLIRDAVLDKRVHWREINV